MLNLTAVRTYSHYSSDIVHFLDNVHVPTKCVDALHLTNTRTLKYTDTIFTNNTIHACSISLIQVIISSVMFMFQISKLTDMNVLILRQQNCDNRTLCLW